MKEANLVWDTRTLDAYLTDPQKVVPGNRMPFPGLKSETDRKDVIAFLSAPAASPTAASNSTTETANRSSQNQSSPSARPGAQVSVPGVPHATPDMPDAKYTIRSGIAEGRMVFIGVGGNIDGKVNPVLAAAEGQIVQVTLINGEGPSMMLCFQIRMRDQLESPVAVRARPLRFRSPNQVTTYTIAASPAIGWPEWKASSS